MLNFPFYFLFLIVFSDEQTGDLYLVCRVFYSQMDQSTLVRIWSTCTWIFSYTSFPLDFIFVSPTPSSPKCTSTINQVFTLRLNHFLYGDVWAPWGGQVPTMRVIQVHTHTLSFFLTHIPSPSPHPHLPPFTSQIFIYVSGHLPVLITPHQLLLLSKISSFSLTVCNRIPPLFLAEIYTWSTSSPFSRFCLTVGGRFVMREALTCRSSPVSSRRNETR